MSSVSEHLKYQCQKISPCHSGWFLQHLGRSISFRSVLNACEEQLKKSLHKICDHFLARRHQLVFLHGMVFFFAEVERQKNKVVPQFGIAKLVNITPITMFYCTYN